MLFRVPTVFGRLTFLASLYNPSIGRYDHFHLSRLVGPEDADRMLRRSHYQIFTQWLSFGLAEQRADFEAYLSTIDVPECPRTLREAVPRQARDMERQLYLMDLQLLLELR